MPRPRFDGEAAAAGVWHLLESRHSLAVSRKVGYRPNGVVRLKRRDGEMALNQKLVLTPGELRRGDPLEVIGAEDLRSFLGLCEP